MKRYTHAGKLIDEQTLDQALQRLSDVEDLLERIESEQRQIQEQMDALKQEGKEKSMTFRQLFGKKVTNNTLLSYLHTVIR